MANTKTEHGIEFHDMSEDNMLDGLLPRLEELAKEYQKSKKKPGDSVREMRMAGLPARRYHTPGGEDHEQETHGNWADGSGGGDAKKSGLFADKAGADSAASRLKEQLKLPHVSVGVSTLGGAHRASVHITVSLEEKDKWVNGILENSAHAKFFLSHDGTLEMISGYKVDKLRKSKVKSVDDAISKINKLAGR